MKKYLVTILVVLSMLTMFVGTVGAAPSSIKLLESVWTGGGVKFTFEITGDIEGGGWLLGNVSWADGSVKMTCNQEGSTVTCMAPKSVADKNIIVTFQGSSFYTYVKSRSFCYDVYDWPLDESTTWVNYGSVCQDAPADYGDLIEWYNPDWDETFPYEFLPESPTPCIFDPVMGDAYYFPGCPATPV